MSVNLNHIKKGESVADKQLVLINSNERDSPEQSSSSFTYTFEQPIERISKMEVMYAKVPKTFYNVNNDNASMSVTTETLSETYTTNLVVDDDEIKTGNILATNIIDGTVFRTNSLQSNGNVKIYKIVTRDSFLYVIGQFCNNLIDFTNYNGTQSILSLTNIGECDIFIAKYTIEQELISRWRIGGCLDETELYIQATSEYVFTTGQFNSHQVRFYNYADNYLHSIVSDGNLTGFITRYDINGNFGWVVKIMGINPDISPLLVTLDDTDKSIYVTGTYKNTLEFYDTSGVGNSTNIITIPYNGSGDTFVFVAKYTYNGDLVWVTSMRGGCLVTSISFNTITSQPIIGIEFFKPLSFSREYENGIVSTAPVGTPLELVGIQNLAIVELKLDGDIFDRMRIGGSNFESGIKIDSVNNILVVSGLYSSNPLRLYNSDDMILGTININGTVNNLFFIKYTLSNTEKMFSFGSNMYSITDMPDDFDISTSAAGDILIIGNYAESLKFNDIDGPVTGKDLFNEKVLCSNTFIVKYGSGGVFQNREYIEPEKINDVISVSIDAHSNNVFIAGQFNSTAIYLHNSDNTVNSSISNMTNSFNGFLASYINNINNFSIDTTTLDKRIICKALAGTDLNYVINLNSFSQQLGLNKSVLMKATIFGFPISWDAIIITSLNNVLSFEFRIGNKQSNTFKRYYYNLTITRLGSYRPYNLAFELNKIIKLNLASQTVLGLDPANEFVKYDTSHKIFYIIFPINGTFKITNTSIQALSGPDGLNMPLTVSNHCTIADISLIDETPVDIVDSSKLMIDLSESFTETRFSNVNFSTAFPNISGVSGSLTVHNKPNNRVTLVAGDVNDNIDADISPKDNISFDAPWQDSDRNSAVFKDKLQWSSISSNFDNTIITAVVYDGHIYVSTLNVIYTAPGWEPIPTSNDCETWLKKEFSRKWRSVSVSHTGQYQTAVVENGQIYISNSSGNKWDVRESIRNWVDIAISRDPGNDDGLHQTALEYGGYIFVSHNRGNTWTARGPRNYWSSVTLDSTGVYQVATVLGGSIWYSTDGGESWNESLNTTNYWKSIDMTNDGSLVAAVANSDKIYYSENKGAAWDSGTIVGNGKILDNISIAKSNKLIQFVSSMGGCIHTTTDGTAWLSNRLQENWSDITVSDDGINQMAVIKNGNIYKLNNLTSKWAPINDQDPWLSIVMSADGLYQMACSEGGLVNQSGLYKFGLWQSSDGGHVWNKVYGIPRITHDYRYTGLAMSSDGVIRYCTTIEGLFRSYDYGVTWSKVVGGFGKITGVALSSDGRHVTAVELRRILVSNDFGITFTYKENKSLTRTHSPDTDGHYYSVIMNSDGSVQIAYGFFGGNFATFYISYNYWDTHVEPIEQARFNLSRTSAISADGTVIIARTHGVSRISRDGGVTFTALTIFASIDVRMFAISHDGTYITAACYNNFIYVSNDSGYTFNNVDIHRLYHGVAMSLTGEIQTIVVEDGNIYRSNDYGSTWIINKRVFGDTYDTLEWRAISVSRNGKYIVACAAFDKMYLSRNYGKTFRAVAGNDQQWSSAAISDDGQKIVGLYGASIGWQSGVQTSWDGGVTFYNTSPTGTMSDISAAQKISMSYDGEYTMVVGIKSFNNSTQYVWISTNSSPPAGQYDDSWALDNTRVIRDTDPIQLFAGSFYNIAMNKDGTVRYMISYGRFLYKFVLDTHPEPKPAAPVYNQWYEIYEISQNAPYSNSVVCSDTGEKVVLAGGGRIRISNDYGVTFSVDVGPFDIGNQTRSVSIGLRTHLLASIEISGDGLTQVAVGSGTILYVSYDDWATYTTHNKSDIIRAVIAISSNGYQIVTADHSGGIYQSFDRGMSFGLQQTDMLPTQIDIGGNNRYKYSISQTRELYTNYATDGNNQWVSNGLALGWSCIASAKNSDIGIAVAGTSYGKLYINVTPSDNSEWVVCGPADLHTSRRWSSCAVSGNGRYKLASEENGILYLSNDYDIETVWTDSGAGSRNWSGCAINSNGDIMAAIDYGGYIYISNNYGSSWNQTADPRNWNSIASNAENILFASVYDGFLYWSDFFPDAIPIPERLWNAVTTVNRKWTKVSVSSAPITIGQFYYSAVALNDYIYTADHNLIFTPRSSIKNWSSIDMVNMGNIQYAVDYNNDIYESRDYGNTWAITPLIKELSSISINNTGEIIAAVENFGNLYISRNFGATWDIYDTERPWNIIKVSNDGITMVAAVNADNIHISTDSGLTWVREIIEFYYGISNYSALDINSDASVILYYDKSSGAGRKVGGEWYAIELGFNLEPWTAVTVSAIGDIQYAAPEYPGTNGIIRKSTDYGATWQFINSQPPKQWSAIDTSSNGLIVTAVTTGGYIYVSTNGGVTWAERASIQNWVSIALSSDGFIQIAVVNGGRIYVSDDIGVIWTAKDNNLRWHDVAVSNSGSFQVACTPDRIFLHDFEVNKRITFTVDTTEINTVTGSKVYAVETSDSTYAKIHNYDLAQGLGFTITRTIDLGPKDIFIPVGNYTPTGLIDIINGLIRTAMPQWADPYGFAYDEISGKVTFTALESGSNILISTNLLTQMGFANVPTIFTAGVKITSTNLLNADISGPLNIFIKSNIISSMRKHRTAFARNKKLKNIIAPLILHDNTNTFNVPYPIEIFLSEKSKIETIDMAIVDEFGNIVNLNGNPVQINFYLYSS